MPFLGTVSCGAQDEFLLGRLIFLLIPAGLGTVSYGAQIKIFWVSRTFLGIRHLRRDWFWGEIQSFSKMLMKIGNA